MKCPVCGSENTYAHFDTASIGLHTLICLMSCKSCNSSWEAMFLHQYNENVYDYMNDTFVASKKHAKRKCGSGPDKWDCIQLYRTSDAPDNAIADIMMDWYYKSKEYGDKGSCVLGAGFKFRYKGHWYFMPAQSPWQGSLSWESSVSYIESRLYEIGAEDITYDWGWMD